MKRLTRTAAALPLALLVLAGCASTGGWTPTVDPTGDPNAANISRDQFECRQLAQQAAGGLAKETGKGALGGGALGGAAGAIIGAIGGDVNTGKAAGIGAAVGALTGGATKAYQQDRRFKEAYTRCMQGRGHRVI